MKKQGHHFQKIFIGLLLFLMLSCSWNNQISNYQPPKNIEDGNVTNFTIVKDSVKSSLGNCLRQKYLRLPDSAHYYSDCDCPDGMELDSIFGEKHRIIWSRINTLAPKNPHYLFSKSTYRFYDQQGRPIKQTTTIYETDTNYQYQQYFNEAGELKSEKLPFYDFLELGAR
jgi:hypothetical protein